MRLKAIFSIILFSALIFLSGCETSKGFAKGMTEGVGGGVVQAATLTSKGAAKDSSNFFQAILRADKWIEENLW